MYIFPAIDLIGAKCVRLKMGDYSCVTVYSDDPVSFAKSFENDGARYLHAVDLEGAKSGGTPNFDTVSKIVAATGLKVEIGGGIRDEITVNRYLDAGVFRVILGTAAVRDPAFLERMAALYGKKIAVGVDIRDGMVSVAGWTEDTGKTAHDFLSYLENIGIKAVIVTDISKDGMMRGTNTELYRAISSEFSFDITASGGVTTAGDIQTLSEIRIFGAILGKALYEKRITLQEAITAAK